MCSRGEPGCCQQQSQHISTRRHAAERERLLLLFDLELKRVHVHCPSAVFILRLRRQARIEEGRMSFTASAMDAGRLMRLLSARDGRGLEFECCATVRRTHTDLEPGAAATRTSVAGAPPVCIYTYEAPCNMRCKQGQGHVLACTSKLCSCACICIQAGEAQARRPCWPATRNTASC